VTLGVPGRLRPRIFSTVGTTRVVGRQPNAPAAFIAEEIPGSHFQRLNRPQGKEPQKKSQVTPPGIDPGTVRLVVQRLNHYATPGPNRTKVSETTQTNALWPVPAVRQYKHLVDKLDKPQQTNHSRYTVHTVTNLFIF
jgi:hypothetical protein